MKNRAYIMIFLFVGSIGAMEHGSAEVSDEQGTILRRRLLRDVEKQKRKNDTLKGQIRDKKNQRDGDRCFVACCCACESWMVIRVISKFFPLQ